MQWQNLLKLLKSRLSSLSDQQREVIERIASTKPENFKIPSGVGTLPKDTESVQLEERVIIVRFDALIESECNWIALDETKMRAILRILRRLTAMKLKDLHGSRLVRGDLNRDDPRYKAYNSLFVKIPPDLIIKEIEIPGAGRIFFYMREERCYIASIETQHRPID